MVSAHTDRNSLSAKLRGRRMGFLDEAIKASGKRLSAIADLGGTRSFWEMNLPHLEHRGRLRRIDIFNLEVSRAGTTHLEGIEVHEMPGDVTRLGGVSNGQYDIAFSNSVIEHVGNLASQRAFARELARIADRFVMQTPNRRFPLEPHFYFPFFQYLPLGVRERLHRRFKLGWLERRADPLQARIDCDQIRLLTRRELGLLFPGARIQGERLAGAVKSFIVTGEGVPG